MTKSHSSVLVFLLCTIMILVCSWQVSCGQQHDSLDSYELVLNKKGYSFYQKTTLTDTLFVQVIDPRKVTLRQYQTNPKVLKEKGEYLGLQVYAFDMTSAEQVLSVLDTQRLVSLLNGAFFESYDQTSAISFPIKSEGFITDGLSVFGPSNISKPYNEFYKNTALKALIWKKNTVEIINFSQTLFEDKKNQQIMVSFEASAHPALVIGKNQPNRYHLMSVKKSKKGNRLVILTCTNQKIDSAIRQIQAMSGNDTVLTLDGGSSVVLYVEELGFLSKAHYANEKAKANLPHYVYFVRK